MKKWIMLSLIMGLGFVQPAWSAGDQDLAKIAAKQAGVTQKQARAVLDAAKQEIVAQLKAGEEVRLKGLGKFYAKHRNAHQGHNPKTGKKVDVPARNYLRFKAFDSGNSKLN
jgi:nucleoid DNA-binding protein